MTVRHVALVNRSHTRIDLGTLDRWAHTLTAALARDFAPAWGVTATVAAYPADGHVPTRSWPVWLLDHPETGLGVHLDRDGHPFAEVTAHGHGVFTTICHEVMEMLVDPLGGRLVSGLGMAGSPQEGRHVSYLVEVCDPVEETTYQTVQAFEGGLSDFVTQGYYHAGSEGPWDHTGGLRSALSVQPGGYISYRDDEAQRWWQLTPDGGFVDLGPADYRLRPRDDRDRLAGAKGLRRADAD